VAQGLPAAFALLRFSGVLTAAMTFPARAHGHQ